MSWRPVYGTMYQRRILELPRNWRVGREKYGTLEAGGFYGEKIWGHKRHALVSS
jgi:hypothetical protein